MNEEMKLILEMVSEGKITVEEAQRLIETLQGENDRTGHEALEAYNAGGLSPKRISIVITENGRNKVNMRIPFSLVRVGLKLGQSFGGLSAKYMENKEEAWVFDMLKEIDIDEVMSSIVSGEISLPYTMIDVEDVEKGEMVKIEIQ